jgi:carbamate kinase
MLQGELAAERVPAMPLHIMDAESQGSVGFLLAQALSNRLRQKGVEREAVAVVTRVVVDPADPTFTNPTKPIGLFYGAEEAERMRREMGWVVSEDAGRGFRRRVASPTPLRILEAGLIGRLAGQGVITIGAGGGGVPVVERPDGTLQGVDAVVDKDRASALLGCQAGAERLLILTSVDAVYTGFGTPGQNGLRRLDAGRARELLLGGEFPAGSMGPKIEAAVAFLECGGREVRIGLPEDMENLLSGSSGTLLTAD